MLTRDGLSKYFHNPSPEVRLAAYSELYRVYGENKTVLAQIYAYLVRDLRAEAIDLRNYKSPIACVISAMTCRMLLSTRFWRFAAKTPGYSNGIEI